MKCIRRSTIWSMTKIIRAIITEAIITMIADLTNCFLEGQEVL